MYAMVCRPMLPLGSDSRSRVFSVSCCRTVWVSTVGAAPLTVIVSSSAPTLMVMLTVAVKPEPSATPSRLTVEKPVSVNVTVYVPGRRSTMLYRPSPSVVTVLTFSIKAGLADSTVTPGMARPAASLTTPAMPEACWARAAGVSTNPTMRTAKPIPRLFLVTHASSSLSASSDKSLYQYGVATNKVAILDLLRAMNEGDIMECHQGRQVPFT